MRPKYFQLRQAATATFLAVLLFAVPALAQKTKLKALPNVDAVLWERVDEPRDLYIGPGGDEMKPDLTRVRFIRKEKGGTQKKYRIEDGSGRIWVAKLGREARPETAAVRLLWGLGYVTEVNYLVPKITIPGKGTFYNVRLEARPKHIERRGEWKWRKNPFVGKPEFQGLKIMQIFMTNWDVLDKQNEVLEVTGRDGRRELHYIVSDLGRTFGKYGNNNLPIIYRLGRRTGAPEPYSRASFIKGMDKKGRIKWGIKGKNRGIYEDISVKDARWLLTQLRRLSDKQIEDAFRAANYSPREVDLYRSAIKRRITELEHLAGDARLAAR